MSGRKDWVLEAVPAGGGLALDLGGGVGQLRNPLVQRGWRYTNLDLNPKGEGAVIGDAHRLPFDDKSFDLIVSADSLEHLVEPKEAIGEMRRTLSDDGLLVIWVPFLHPFHGNDYYRYTHLGLRYLLEAENFAIDAIEAPLWIFTIIGQAIVEILRRCGLGALESEVERGAAWLDRRSRRFQGASMAFANAYLVTARPK